VADDDWDALQQMERALTLQGYEVWTATDGLQALDWVQKVRPDLVLLDVDMPMMDGYEVVRHIKKNSEMRKTPVILTTDRSVDKEREKVRVLGVDVAEYLTKPLSIEVLIREIKKAIAARSRVR
jgi:chemosensory pili system protein ChpA (sensor histidine kinase/response regulator)